MRVPTQSHGIERQQDGKWWRRPPTRADKLMLASAFGLTFLAAFVAWAMRLSNVKQGLGHVSWFASFWLWVSHYIERIYWRGAGVDLELDFVALFLVFGVVFLIRRQWKYAFIVIVIPLVASLAFATRFFD